MSLFVDQSTGADTGNATVDLFTISWDDGNLGQGADTTVTGGLNGITSIPVAPVTYTSVTTGKDTANRLLQVVNTSSGLHWAEPIVITALFGGIDPYSGMDVTGNGFTYVDTNVTPNVIHIAYDTSQANGQGLALFDVDGHAIQSPNAVILYHEMSHAFHEAINQIPFPQNACPGNTSDEPAAEIDENVMRTELGLCLRDVCNHGGETGWGKACGGSATPGGPPLVDGSAPDDGGDGGCFVVTAATGTPHAVEIARLRALRDRLAARSPLAGAMIAAIYDEYFTFSPAIAARVAVDPAARAMVRQVVVAPLLAWFELAEQLTRDHGDEVAVDRHVAAVTVACPAEAAAGIAPLLGRLASGSVDPEILAIAPDLARIVELPFAAWAVMRPLLAVWTSAPAKADLVDAVADWLGAAPVERLASPADERNLESFAPLFDFAPAARRQIGVRLDHAWPERRHELGRHGFLA